MIPQWLVKLLSCIVLTLGVAGSVIGTVMAMRGHLQLSMDMKHATYTPTWNWIAFGGFIVFAVANAATLLKVLREEGR